jgi:hypothetical protein
MGLILNRGDRSTRSGPQPHCQVCFAPDTTPQAVQNETLGKSMTVRVCSRCGYVEMPENTHDYTTSTSTDSLGLAPRVGTEEVAGREFGMAKLGAAVLKRPGLSVLIYGVGRSMDNHHIAKIPSVKRVAIGDIMKIRDDGEFVDLGKPATERFDIVVACEVVEHFEDPHTEFAKLFAFVADDGILICSTNIYDGGDLNHQRYIFGRGHVSYYTPQAVRAIAKANDYRLDFRLPLVASGGGKRKRYLLFTRSPDVIDNISDWFGRRSFAPSEPPGLRQRRDAGRPRKAKQAAGRAARKTAPGGGRKAGRGSKRPNAQG